MYTAHGRVHFIDQDRRVILTTKVPTPAITRALRAYLVQHPEVTQEEFLKRADMKMTTFRNLHDGLSKSIDFSMADRVLCAIGCPSLWHSDPDLREAYYAVDLTPRQPWELALVGAEAA